MSFRTRVTGGSVCERSLGHGGRTPGISKEVMSPQGLVHDGIGG